MMTYAITIVTISNLFEADDLNDRRKATIHSRYLNELAYGIAGNHLHFLKRKKQG
jgi:hypothetical protein